MKNTMSLQKILRSIPEKMITFSEKKNYQETSEFLLNAIRLVKKHKKTPLFDAKRAQNVAHCYDEECGHMFCLTIKLQPLYDNMIEST